MIGAYKNYANYHYNQQDNQIDMEQKSDRVQTGNGQDPPMQIVTSSDNNNLSVSTNGYLSNENYLAHSEYQWTKRNKRWTVTSSRQQDVYLYQRTLISPREKSLAFVLDNNSDNDEERNEMKQQLGDDADNDGGSISIAKQKFLSETRK